MSAPAFRYVSSTWNADKVMAIAQFLPMALAGPTRSAGCEALGKSLSNLSQMADGYRSITRLSLLLNALSEPTLKVLRMPQGDALYEFVDPIIHFFHVCYCIFENTAVLAGRGVLPNRLTRLGSCAVTCWFYTLLIGLVRQIYTLTQKKHSEAELKAGLIKLTKVACFLVFSLTCIPANGPQLIENMTGALVPIHRLMQCITPKHLELNDCIRGLLGFTASVCDFY